ncbi:Hemin uptake protein hemP [Neorhodopirellula lusitana]|uniref:Hemin uptake protein hemP n=1 Tax=Neorhodopirellula lusitana TaxID=445327 RepID=A0ABY1QMN5_9BACT|nr:hemin uptake protein HemP [Neorhodopirellula lusitana]SMP74276.1 Hemin uptake protein hemP [Neorhodopirellula lusitana]
MPASQPTDDSGKPVEQSAGTPQPDADLAAGVPTSSVPMTSEPADSALQSVNVGPNASQSFKMVRFETLARCGDEIWIENEGQIYRLRRTRQGKLILTK